MVYYNSASDKVNDSSRIAFEPLGPTHAPELFPLFEDDRIYRYIPLPRYRTIEEIRERVTKLSEHGPGNGRSVWLNWILKEKAKGKYIGWVQATLYENKSASIAYVIFPEFWKQGYAKEACSTIIAHLYSNSDIETIFAEIDTRNNASIALIRSLGFTLAGERKNADFFNGSKSDEYRFELAKREKR